MRLPLLRRRKLVEHRTKQLVPETVERRRTGEDALLFIDKLLFDTPPGTAMLLAPMGRRPALVV